MRACFAAMPDVVEAVSPLPRRVAPLTTVLRQNVLYVSFLIPFGNESLTHAVLIFGTNENDARTRGELILLAARANPELPPPSVAGANGNLAFFTLGELTRSIAGELKTCFTRSARAPFAL